MYPVSDSYKQAIVKDNINTKIIGTITLKDNTVINVTSEDIVQGSLYFSEQCFSGDDIDIGSVYASEMGLSLITDITNPYTLDGARILLNFGIDTGEENWEYVPLGYYYVTEIDRKSRIVNLKALDGMMLLSHADLISVLKVGTPRQIIDSICTKVGVLLTTDIPTFSTFPNNTAVFTLPEDSKVETCRDYLMWVCQLIGCFARMNRMGNLEIVAVTNREPVRTIEPDHRFSSDISDFYVKVTRLSTKIGETEYSQGVEGMTMVLEENPLLVNKELGQINSVLGNILANLAEYVPFSADLYGDPALQAGDFVDVKVNMEADAYPNADENGIVKTLITHSNWKYRGSHNIKASGKSGVLKNILSQTDKSTSHASQQAQSAAKIADAAQRAAEAAEEEAQLAQQLAEEAQSLADAAQITASEASQQADTANQNALDAVGLAGEKGKVIYSTTTPAASDRNVSNLWIDTSGTPPKNQPKRWNTFEWVAVTDQIAVNAASQAAAANTLAASKVTTLYQASPPVATGRTVGDLWIDTDDKNKLYRWSGTAWLAVDDLRLQEALTAAASAVALADGKIRTFAQATAPSGMTVDDEGDLWIDTDDQNKMYRWSGSAWVVARDAGIGIAQGTADAAAGVAATAQAAAGDAATAAQNARSVADAAELAALQAQEDADKAAQAAATAQSTASSANSTANAAQTAAQNANTTLSDLSNDNKLTPDEKQTTRKEWNIIAGEKAGINTQAASFGITTENTTYNTAYTALGTYLNNGTAYTSGIPTWITDANLGTTTTIIGNTFRDKFKVYYDARTALLNAISAKAKSLADAAQVKANSASTAASTAQTTATNAQTSASNAASAASTAQSTANAAQTAAQNAAQLAQEAKDIATAANQSTQLINDAIGGNVLIREKGSTNEILIMDASNPAQARKIWRWNIGGFGFSNNVVGADNAARTYNVAMTMDGAINADFITAGTIRGIEIIGATFRTSGASNRLQMDTTFKAYNAGIKRVEIDYRSANFYDPAGSLLGTIVADTNMHDGDTNVFGIYVPSSPTYERVLNIIAPKIIIEAVTETYFDCPVVVIGSLGVRDGIDVDSESTFCVAGRYYSDPWYNHPCSIKADGDIAVSGVGKILAFSSLESWSWIEGRASVWNVHAQFNSAPQLHIGWTNTNGTYFSAHIANWSRRDIKENIHEYDYELAYDQIKNLPIYSYQFKERESEHQRKLGFILDEAPFEVLESMNEEPSIIDMYGVASLTIAALKEAQNKINELENRILLLEAI